MCDHYDSYFPEDLERRRKEAGNFKPNKNLKPSSIKNSSQLSEVVSECCKYGVANEELQVKPQFGEWQLCPKCNGDGTLLNPITCTAVSRDCPVCNGAKVLARPIIK